MPSLTIDTTVDINAGRDAVWDVLTDFASYTEWNPVTRIEGAAEAGTNLVVHLTGGGHGMSLKPNVLAATHGKELQWLGKLGLRSVAAGEHVFVLTTNDDGTTRLNHGATPAHRSRLQEAAQRTVSLPMKDSVRPSNNASSISTELEDATCAEGKRCRYASPERALTDSNRRTSPPACAPAASTNPHRREDGSR